MNIFVSGLSYSLSSDELSEVFAQFGTVASARVITDKQTGRSRGFGFVEMPMDEEARNAISQLDQSEVKGRKIAVKEAEERAPRTNDRPRNNYGGGGGGRGGDGGYRSNRY
jgi:RNA recognition motif-containing protein